jgi:hypothetical protein
MKPFGSMPAPSPSRVDEAVAQACREFHLDPALAGSVHAYLEEDEDLWPACCGSSCEPCVQTLGSAARRALILLETPGR